MAKYKYLRKNEFRYNKNPEVMNPRGEGHVAYVTVRNKRHSKINIITHSNTFFGKPTEELLRNPEKNKKRNSWRSSEKSRFSVPVWEKNSNLKEKPKGIWRMSNEDRKRIHKFNKKYEKQRKK